MDAFLPNFLDPIARIWANVHPGLFTACAKRHKREKKAVRMIKKGYQNRHFFTCIIGCREPKIYARCGAWLSKKIKIEQRCS